MGVDTSAGASREQELVRLVDAYQFSLRRMCCAILRDRALAEDAVQETFLKAYKTLDTFRKESSEKTWLMRIAINTCRDFRRSAWFRSGIVTCIVEITIPEKNSDKRYIKG